VSENSDKIDIDAVFDNSEYKAYDEEIDTSVVLECKLSDAHDDDMDEIDLLANDADVAQNDSEAHDELTEKLLGTGGAHDALTELYAQLAVWS
jgi:hypothetical protein